MRDGKSRDRIKPEMGRQGENTDRKPQKTKAEKWDGEE